MGKRILKYRSLPGFAFHENLAAVFLDDGVGDGKAQPASVGIAGKKGIEDEMNVVGRDAGAVVGDGQLHPPAFGEKS